MKNLPVYLILIGIIAFFIFRDVISPVNDSFQSDTIYLTTIVPGDSFPFLIDNPVPVPHLVYRDTGTTHWKNNPIDTAEILREYFSIYFYSDTVSLDSSFFAIIEDSVSCNRIINRQFYFQNLKETAILTTILPPPLLRNRFFVGLGAGGNPFNFDATANILYTLPRKKMAVSATYGVISNNFYLTAYFKIK